MLPRAPQAEAGDHRALMGYASGWMFIAVGATGLLGLLSPALRFHLGWQAGLGVAVVIYGLLTVRDVMDWAARPMSAHIAAMFAALPIVALGLWASGGTWSYLRPVLLLAPIHWGFFLERRLVLAALCGGLIAAFWTPFLYQTGAGQHQAIALTSTLSLTIIILAIALSLIRDRLQAAEQAYRELATLDPLTGLLNRRGFREGMTQLLASARADRAPYLVLLDLDHLKHLNDSHGHAVGDDALRAVAARLKANTRPRDVVARLGGDEFVVAGHTCQARGADRIASRLQLAVSGELEKTGVHVAASTGWSINFPSGTEPRAATQTALQEADEGLFVNKRTRHATIPGGHRSPGSQGLRRGDGRIEALDL
jgi:diguanylate cyclase (GGDEF)-like protein